MLGAAAAAPFARAGRSAAAPPNEELEAALERQRSDFAEMKKTALPVSVEPASVFRP